jgi:hypothetical protein
MPFRRGNAPRTRRSYAPVPAPLLWQLSGSSRRLARDSTWAATVDGRPSISGRTRSINAMPHPYAINCGASARSTQNSINIEAAQNDFSLDVVPPAPHCDLPPHQSNRNAGSSGEISTHRPFSAHRTPTGETPIGRRASRIASALAFTAQDCPTSIGRRSLGRA